MEHTHLAVVFWFWKWSCKRPVDLYICTCPVKQQDYCALTKHHKLQPKPLHAEQPHKPAALEHTFIQPTG